MGAVPKLHEGYVGVMRDLLNRLAGVASLRLEEGHKTVGKGGEGTICLYVGIYWDQGDGLEHRNDYLGLKVLGPAHFPFVVRGVGFVLPSIEHVYSRPVHMTVALAWPLAGFHAGGCGIWGPWLAIVNSKNQRVY